MEIFRLQAAGFSSCWLVWTLGNESHSCGGGEMKKPKQTDESVL